MKKLHYSVIITFTALVLIMFALSLFPDSDGFSAFENRKLSSRPLLSFNGIFSGEFEEDYEEYLLDNFLLRDLSVQGYQSYAGLFFLDAFSESVSVLMSVNVDDFVQAPGGDTEPQSSTVPQSSAGRQASAGHRSSDVPGGNSASMQQQTDGMDTEGTQLSDAEQGGVGAQQGGTVAEQGGTGTQQSDADSERSNPGAEQDDTGEEKDQKLNNSLIIHGDRVMMPTGARGLKSFGGLLAQAAELLPDVSFYSITGPTSAAFYASETYSTGAYDQSKAESIIEANATGVRVVKVYDRLMKHRDENIYFRSDVHWTALGAYYAYAAFCEAAGIQPASLDDDYSKDTYKPFLGGLYSQIYKLPQAARLKNNPEQLDYYIPKTGHQLTLFKMGNMQAPYNVDSIINTDFKSLGAYKYSCFAWGDQRLEKITTDSPASGKVLVIKDSYGSAFVPFLVPNYSTIYVIDPKGFNQEGCLSFDAKTLIKDEGIEDVIFCFSIYGSGRSIIQNTLTSLLLE
jgi:hypothetical protein